MRTQIFSFLKFGRTYIRLSFFVPFEDDSAEGFAKLMARRMGLDDEDHEHRLFARLTVEMKKYEDFN